MANKFIETLRRRVPYIHRLHCRIDELQHRLAAIEAVPELRPLYGSESAAIAAQFRAFLRLLQPHDVAAMPKRRFGADHDGGYILLDDFGPARTALSLGIGLEISWDIAMAGRGLRVVQFDDGVAGPPQHHAFFEFHRARVVGASAPGAPGGHSPNEVTLAKILAQGDLEADNDVIAKIDIEGSEWEILATTATATLARLRQVAIEFHDVRRFVEGPWRATALAALQNLMRTHACIHIHGNNWSPFTVVGGIPFPNAFEASFARRRDCVLHPSTAEFPTELDRPCNPKRPELHLGRWDY